MEKIFLKLKNDILKESICYKKIDIEENSIRIENNKENSPEYLRIRELIKINEFLSTYKNLKFEILENDDIKIVKIV